MSRLQARSRKRENIWPDYTGNLPITITICLISSIATATLALLVLNTTSLEYADRIQLSAGLAIITLYPIIAFQFWKKGKDAGFLLVASMLLVPLFSIFLFFNFITRYM